MASRKPAVSTRPLPASAHLSRTGAGSSGGRRGTPVPSASSSTSTSTSGAGALKPPPGPAVQNLLDKDRKMVEYSSPLDKCPVCFSDRYLNPALRLLVSKCYHKMCESCIDRIFTLGPGPCPICGQIIRKTQFTPQTYEDLGVEKEVIIRKRIAKIFNKTQEDFPDLQTFNNYLEEVEDMTFNLINAVDVEETDRKILAYQRENAEQIDMQSSFEDKHAELIRAQDEEERRRKQEQAAEFAQRDAAERAEREKEEQELLQLLEASGEGEDASKVIRKHRAVALKRSSARMASDTTQNSHAGAGSGKPSLLSRYAGFNRNSFAAEQSKKDPFAPEDTMADYDTAFYDYRDLFTLRSVEQPYVDKGTHEVLRDGKKQGGGFDVRKSVWERAIRSAVMGLWTPPVGVSNAGVKTDRDGDAVMS